MHNLNKISVKTWKYTARLLRLNNKCISNLAYEYIPSDKKKVVRPRKRWRNQNISRLNKPTMAYTLLTVADKWKYKGYYKQM
jgi:hypothetical protein